MAEAERVHSQAMRSVLHAAQQLAVLTCSDELTEQQKAHFHQLAKLLTYARDSAMLAFDSVDATRPRVVSPAPRTVCLHCGAVYEQVDDLT